MRTRRCKRGPRHSDDCLRDDSATVRVANQDPGFELLIEDPSDKCRIVSQGSRWVLRDAHLMTGLAEAAIHGLPPRTVDKTTVYEDHRFHCAPFGLPVFGRPNLPLVVHGLWHAGSSRAAANLPVPRRSSLRSQQSRSALGSAPAVKRARHRVCSASSSRAGVMGRSRSLVISPGEYRRTSSVRQSSSEVYGVAARASMTRSSRRPSV